MQTYVGYRQNKQATAYSLPADSNSNRWSVCRHLSHLGWPVAIYIPPPAACRLKHSFNSQTNHGCNGFLPALISSQYLRRRLRQEKKVPAAIKRRIFASALKTHSLPPKYRGDTEKLIVQKVNL